MSPHGARRAPVTLFGETWEVVPDVVVFDVDFTLWPYWCDTHLRPPFRLGASGQLRDGSGKPIALYPEAAAVLLELRAAGVQLALASRTDEPRWLQDIAQQLAIAPGLSLWDAADFREIYPSSKIKHFQAIAAASGAPPSRMLFFDDESRNRNVTSLGVTFVDADGGVSVAMVREGLRQYQRERRP